jgi:hypothetical protein
VKTMAEVLAEHGEWRYTNGAGTSIVCRACGEPVENVISHQADALTAAGFGPVKAAQAEAWAEGYMRGRHPWVKVGPFVDPIPSGVGPADRGRNANPYRAAAVEGDA